MNPKPPFIINDFNFQQLERFWILRHCAPDVETNRIEDSNLQPELAERGMANFKIERPAFQDTLSVHIICRNVQLLISCTCTNSHPGLCTHQAIALFSILNTKALHLFFDEVIHASKLKEAASQYGLENEKNLDSCFKVSYQSGQTQISPLLENLLPVSTAQLSLLKKTLLISGENIVPPHLNTGSGKEFILILKKHKYYGHFQADLMEAAITVQGRPKNPLISIQANQFIWTATTLEDVKFYTALSRFQQRFDDLDFLAELAGLKALCKNPAGLSVFLHDSEISENIVATALLPVKLSKDKIEIELQVDLKDHYYTITSSILIAGKRFDPMLLPLKLKYFILYHEILYLADLPEILQLIHFFKKHHNHILIHESKYEQFRKEVLAGLEQRIHINYSYVKKASIQMLKKIEADQGESFFERDLLIYLTDSENYVIINPVMRYGDAEIKVLSRKQIHSKDRKGKVFSISRDEEAELRFLSIVIKQHPYLEEQLQQDAFYLHKKHFLNPEWFLQTFRNWEQSGITVLGFQDLKGNKINPHEGKINIEIISGLDWFDTQLELSFGGQKTSLKQIHKALKNKSKFVVLGDGSQGLLPELWIGRLVELFQLATLKEEKLCLPKTSFASIPSWFEEHQISNEVRMELHLMKQKLNSFTKIEDINVPLGLNGTLRDYQKQGLNWLHFLDKFNFGGILADDMGLGKTIQIISFILKSREENPASPCLIVVPATLIFNWQNEISRFASELKVYTLYGSDRAKTAGSFPHYDIILTSYGTLLRDIGWLKKNHFEQIYLDESQQIKNPSSLIYKAVILLDGRTRICLSGTPIENNTFDLYGQLSFACPGLLGSKQHFREQYASPVDQFNDTAKAIELRRKISPFILRRTKKEVAAELPEKTEMVIYCEMDSQQRLAYDQCKNEYRDYLNHIKNDDMAAHTIHILKGLTQLRQICNSPALLQGNLSQEASSAKINVLLEEIANHSPQHKILVFSQFVGMLDLIRKELKDRNIAHEYLSGQSANRQKIVNNFQENDQIRVFLISLKAGGTGLNLTSADYVYLVDPWWNPAVENQAIDRSYRIGQQNHVVAVRLICPDTIEEKIMLLQQRKKELFNDLIHNDSGFFKSLSKSDLLSLLQ